MESTSRYYTINGFGGIKKSKLLAPFIVFLLIGIIAVGTIQPVMAAPTCLISFITTPGIAEGEQTHPGDADGFPDGTIVGNADPGDFQIVVKCTIDSAISGVSVKLLNTNHDPIVDHPDKEDPDVIDFIIDNDNPQNYTSLGIGTHYFFWSLDKDQSVCLVGHSEQYRVNLSWTGPTAGYALSELYNVTADKSTSIRQNDLEAEQTTPLETTLSPGETFRACIKWFQQSSSLDALAAEIYYNGTMLRLYNFTLYHYDGALGDPGDISLGIPAGYDAYWANDTFLNSTQLAAVSPGSTDHWIGCWDFIALEEGTDLMEIYSQTKLSETANWKIGPSNIEIEVTVIRPKITIIKNSIPDHYQDFNFTGNFTTGNFTLDDDGTENNPENSSRTFELESGTYNVTEFVPSGWNLTDITIEENSPTNSSYSLSDANATLVLDNHEWINVTFTNTKRGKITVIKNAIPDDDQDFTFDGNFTTSSFLLDDDGGEGNPLYSSRTFNASPGIYNVSETVPSGWSLTSIIINENSPTNSSTDLSNANATLVVDPGEWLNVTFVNAKGGNIIVIKDAIPDDPQDFTFNTNFTGSFVLDDDGGSDSTFSNLASYSVGGGNYSVSEIVPSGWNLTDITIIDPTSDSSYSLIYANATLNVDSGETVTIIFENTKDGSITVVKDAIPDDIQDFTFNGNFTSSSFVLDDDGIEGNPLYSSRTFNASPGIYNVSETVPSGWILTNITIVEGTSDSSTDLGNNNATLVVSPGESVTVTFENTQRGKVRVIKNAIPDDPQIFTFDGNVTSGTFNLVDNGGVNYQDFDLDPGLYNVTEIIPSGWDLTGINIQEDLPTNSSYNIVIHRALLVVDPGEWINVTFTNEQGKVTVIKDAVPNDIQDFTFDGNVTGTQFTLDDDGIEGNPLYSSRTFNVSVGIYNVTEILQSGWGLTNIVIQDDGADSSFSLSGHNATLNVAAGEWINVTFTNTRSKITVIKDAVPDDIQDFTFDGNVTGTQFTLDDDGGEGNPLYSSRTFNVSAGIYNVTEILPNGWDLTNIAIVETTAGSSYNLGGHNATLDVTAGEWINVTFTNNKTDIEITKILKTEDPTIVGETVTFQINVTNTGSTVLTGVNVSDTYDTTWLDFLSANPTETLQNEALGTINWTNLETNLPDNDLDPTERITILVNFNATDPTPDPTKAQNCAEVDASYDGIDKTVSDGPECDDVEINSPGIEITKVLTSQDPTLVGLTVTFQIDVTNTGDTVLTGVNVSDTFETTYLDFVPPASPAQTSYNEGAGTIDWENLELTLGDTSFDPGDVITITVTFTATAPTPIADRADNCADVNASFNGADKTVFDGPACDDVGISNLDFGDAPDPKYPTLLAGGARHVIGDIWLGSTVDAEFDGQPNPGATGDDIAGTPDDEDGVIFPSLPYLAGSTGSVIVIVSEQTSGIITDITPAYVYGWIDWNQDGDWDDSLENIVHETVTSPGSKTFSFLVPGDAKVGSTYARFRIGDVEGEVNIVDGEASNGEVEDHRADPAVARVPPPPRPTAVGGFFVPVNKLTVLAPYLLMMISAVLTSSILAIRKKYRN